jgi:predicted metal-dependent hydrolase
VALAGAQLELPFSAAAESPPDPTGFAIGSGSARFAVYLVRVRRAKRYIMRVRPDGALRVTIPRGGSRAEAIRFAERHLGWALRQRERFRNGASDAEPWTDGTAVLLDGIPHRIAIERLSNGLHARLGPVTARLAGDDDVRAALKTALRAAAERQLPPELLSLASAHGLAVRRITIRDQRSRWGSCSRSGTIALNYRLIQMPPAVRRYILVHELAHLVHPDHSRKFWRFVESMDPGFRDSERWLKRSGQGLLS